MLDLALKLKHEKQMLRRVSGDSLQTKKKKKRIEPVPVLVRLNADCSSAAGWNAGHMFSMQSTDM